MQRQEQSLHAQTAIEVDCKKGTFLLAVEGFIVFQVVLLLLLLLFGEG